MGSVHMSTIMVIEQKEALQNSSETVCIATTDGYKKTPGLFLQSTDAR